MILMNLNDAITHLQNNNVKTLKIYWHEDVQDDEKVWWVNGHNDKINKLCNFSWTWTIESKENFLSNALDDAKYSTKQEIKEDSDWHIIIDRAFSENVICEGITEWLQEHNFNFNVKIVKPLSEVVSVSSKGEIFSEACKTSFVLTM